MKIRKKKSIPVKNKTDEQQKIKDELKKYFHNIDGYKEEILPGHLLYGFNYEHLTEDELEALYDEIIEARDGTLDDEDADDLLFEIEKKKTYIA